MRSLPGSILAALLLATLASDTPAGEPAPSAEGLDRRTPLVMLPQMADHQKQDMRDHLAAVQQIIAALARDDFGGIVQAAGRIGYSGAMAQMCQHMGAATPGFTEMALGFHHAGDKISDAARRHDRAGVLDALETTLQTCVTCHATYKQQIVDEQTWEKLTKAARVGTANGAQASGRP
jgi:cytochrome c556